MKALPSKDQIRQWIAENPGSAARRDIAKAFGVKGDARADLKRLLQELEEEGALERRARRHQTPGGLPPVAVLQVEPDTQGDLWARPLETGIEAPEAKILIVPQKGDPALGPGDRILARLTPVEGQEQTHEARLIRRLGANPSRVLGIFRQGAEGGRILPIDKGQDREWRVARDATGGARNGELVEAETVGRPRLGLPAARIVARLGDPNGPRAVSLIAIHQHGIPDQFPDDVIAEADAAVAAPLGDRKDLRDLPLVTIDPIDARDRDDAVYAEPDTDPGNPGGHVVWVAIADVAHYVRPGSALDREARRRGNSTYFPDRVVPMLPDILSGDLCSLHEHVDRACIAVRMVLDAHGRRIAQRFHRGLMRSRASLHYGQVQAAHEGRPDAVTEPLLAPIIEPLFAAWKAAWSAREARQPLDLDLPERRIEISDAGKVTSVAFRERFDAHKLIEEFMILANVAAAEELVRLRTPLLFRVHEEPTPEKLEALREVAEGAGLSLARGQVLQTRSLNRLLAAAQGTDFDELINIATLRSMPQAYYSAQNFGHFGLALKSYAHFTSPIRRYSDLIVHRGLITAHGWGDDGLSARDIENLEDTAQKVSDAERRSMMAERETTDRYLAAYLADRVGAEFAGRISGVQRFGLFVKMDETGADGLVPIRSVGREFFHYDPDAQTLLGADTGTTLSIGQRVTVRLTEADPVTGGLMLELLQVEGAAMPGGRPARKGGRAARLPGRARAQARAIRKKRDRKP